MMVGDVLEGTVAERAGLRKGDLLLRVDDMLVAPSPQAVNDVVDKIK